MTLALLLALALLPAIPLEQISDGQLVRARDRWLLGVLTVAIVAAAWAGEVWLALVGLWFLWHWRTPTLLGSLVTWAGIGATWFAARALPRDLLELLPYAWLTIGLLHLIPATRQWAARETLGPIRGRMGQRTILGGFLALVFPFAPVWLWPALAVGQWLTGPSWCALVALGAGILVLWPWTLWGLVSGLGVAVVVARLEQRPWSLLDRLTPRGKSFDTIRARVACWEILIVEATRKGWWRWGAGPNTMPRTLRRVNSSYHLTLPHLDQNLGDAHNEPLHCAIEYGVLGVLAMLAFTVRVGWYLTWGDPWSAGAVIGAVLALASIPCRVAPLGLTWLVVCAGVIR